MAALAGINAAPPSQCEHGPVFNPANYGLSAPSESVGQAYLNLSQVHGAVM